LAGVFFPYRLADPSPRARPGLVYDRARRRTVLFGGSNNVGALGETWEWDGVVWNQVDIPGPVARFSHCMVYDAGRGRTVLFGGVDGYDGKLLGDTWEYDGSRWIQVADSGPRARIGHAMAWDGSRGRTVLFGGGGAAPDSPACHDTWEWDGSGWHDLAIESPTANLFHRMAFDERRARVVSFGGRGGGADTWEFDGFGWTRVSVAGPRPRDHHAVAYDSGRGRIVLFGGGWQAPEGTPDRDLWLSDLWEWDGQAWRVLLASGPPSQGGQPGLVYDEARQVLVLFGGGGSTDHHLAGTWEWNGSRWRMVR